MQRSTVFLLTLAALTAPAATSFAQNAYLAGAGASGYAEPAPAPIERVAPQSGYQNNYPPQNSQPPRPMPTPTVVATTPAQGVLVRADRPNGVQTVAADANRVELRLDHGRANISVHDPAANQLVLVDLPGGQTQLLKNGFYTFNADTNTVRVFSGEADAFVGNGDHAIKVKGDDQLVFAGPQSHTTYSDPYYARQDILGGQYSNGQQAGGYPPPAYGPAPAPVYGGYAPYGYGPYGDGYYGGYPYYAYGYPYYPYYGWGYPIGIGFGWGWGGGFYRGGYGFGGGFHGGGFGRR